MLVAVNKITSFLRLGKGRTWQMNDYILLKYYYICFQGSILHNLRWVCQKVFPNNIFEF